MLHILCKNFLTKNGLFPPTVPIIAAVSGGMDSCVLAHILIDLGYDTIVAHCDFELRVESGSEAEFVRETFSERGAEVLIRKFETQAYAEMKKCSIQVAARELRYAWFAELIEKKQAAFCATAHHSDDQAETLLLHWIKGNSPALMKGIPEKRGKFVRPLLNASRAGIFAFATENKIEWREDASNESLKYQRNAIRNRVLPEIRKVNPAFDENLLAHYERYSRQENVLREFLFSRAKDWMQTDVGIQIIQLEKAHAAIGEGATGVFLEFWLADQGWEGKLIPAILQLPNSQTGKTIYGKKWIAQHNRGELVFSPARHLEDSNHEFEVKETEANDIVLETGEQVLSIRKMKWENQDFSEGLLFIDAAKLHFPIRIRHWQAGDRMIPLGMKNEKKLSDIFADEKFSLINKNKAWVIADQNQIAALTGFRIAEPFRIGSQTIYVYEIREL